jgi:hypothetical protein
MSGKHSNKLVFTGAVLFLVICTAGFAALFRRTVNVNGSIILTPTGMNPNFLNQVNECFIPTAAIYGYTLRITSGFRSMTEQAQIYDDGRDGTGTIVSEAPPGHSLHNYGYAVDIVDRWRGYDIDWKQLIAIGAYCHLENGGPGDLPHFEYRDGLSTDDFAAGLRPPPLTLPCPVMATRSAENQPLTLADLKSCGAPDFWSIISKN